MIRKNITSIFSLFLPLFIASMVSAAEIHLAWDANNEEDMAGYKIYYRTQSGVYGDPVDVGNVTEYKLPGLIENEIYCLAVTAYDTSNQEGQKSVEVCGPAIPLNTSTTTTTTSPSTTTSITTTTTSILPDTTDPTITITSPTSGSTYSTSQNTINLGGTASDNVGVTSVTWSNSRGGSGSASGTTSWIISSINLSCGEDNIITVTAEDAAGNTATDALTIDVKPCSPSGLTIP